MNPLFFCDVCCVPVIYGDKVINNYFKCYTSYSWFKHTETLKHIKNKCMVANSDYVCPICQNHFSKGVLEIHLERNKDVLKFKAIDKNSTCNHFIVGKKRFSSWNHYQTYLSSKGKKCKDCGFPLVGVGLLACDCQYETDDSYYM